MIKNLKKISANEKGFSLTEVMIAIMILTVAIISATSLLVGLISSNKNNVKTLQAYYLAQEGVEAVRNIRDTNWLQNQNWMDNSAVWTLGFEEGKDYGIELKTVGGCNPIDPACSNVDRLNELEKFAPWQVVSGGSTVDFDGEKFERTVTILPYECGASECSDFVRVQVRVTWEDGKEREVVLEEVLTNWKGGAL